VWNKFIDVLLGIERQQRQVQEDSEPVSVDHEEEGKESVDTSFRNNVGIETVAKIDRVDVIAAAAQISKRTAQLPDFLSIANKNDFACTKGVGRQRLGRRDRTTQDHYT
jgi:hypothetical protein